MEKLTRLLDGRSSKGSVVVCHRPQTEPCAEYPAKQEQYGDGKTVAVEAGWLIHYTTLSAFVCLKISVRVKSRDFPGGPVVKDLPCSAGDVGSIHSWGTKIARATELVSPCATARASRNCSKDPACCS